GEIAVEAGFTQPFYSPELGSYPNMYLDPKVESRIGAVAWGLLANAPFPIPAHRTGRADFRHPALRLASPHGTWRATNRTRHLCSRCLPSSFRHSSLGGVLSLMVSSAPPPTPSPCPSPKAHKKRGSFAPPASPSPTAHTPLPAPRRDRRLSRR